MPLTTGLIDHLPAHGVLRKFETREQWRQARHSRIGGSSLASLYGYGYKQSKLEFWEEKSNDLPPAPKKMNGKMKRGHKMEPLVLEELADVTDWQVEHWPQTWILDHPTIGGYGCTLDGLAMPTQVNFPFPLEKNELVTVQVKTASEFAKARWPRNEQGGFLMIPPHQIQIQGEIDCAGLRYGVLALQVGMDFDDMVWIAVARDPDFIEVAHEDISEFWETIANGEMPEIDGSEATYDFLRRKYKVTDGSAVNLPGDADIWLAEWREGKSRVKAGEAMITAAKSKFFATIGEAEFAMTPQGEGLTYKSQTMVTIDSGKLRAKYPEAAEACEKVTTFRVLRESKNLPPEALAMLDG